MAAKKIKNNKESFQYTSFIGIASLLIVILCDTCLLAFSELGYNTISKNYYRSIISREANMKLLRLQQVLVANESAERGFLLIRDPLFIESYTANTAELRRLLEQVTEYYIAPSEEDLAGSIDPRMVTLIGLISKRIGEIETTMRLATNYSEYSALDIIKTDIGKNDRNRINALIRELQSEQEFRAVHAMNTIQANIHNFRWITKGLLIFNILFSILSCYWLFSIFRRMRANELTLQKTIEEHSRHVADLTLRMQNISEAEKFRLAQELHDDLGANLTAAKMDVAYVKKELEVANNPLNEKLERAIANLIEGIQIKRRLIEGLRPITLATFGLVTAAREMLQQVAEQAAWKLELDFPDTDPDLTEEAEITLFRILQEAVTNSAKYAHATWVRASLMWVEGDCYKLEIEDNGVGFCLSNVRPKAIGLIGMRERIEHRGGQIDIRSSPGSGTLIRAILPNSKNQTK